MKKYIMPTVKVADIKPAVILAGSMGKTNDTEGYSEDGYEGGYSKQRGIFDYMGEE